MIALQRLRVFHEVLTFVLRAREGFEMLCWVKVRSVCCLILDARLVSVNVTIRW